jgi:hypothetical protein
MLYADIDSKEEISDTPLEDPAYSEGKDRDLKWSINFPLIRQMCFTFWENKMGQTELLHPIFLRIHNLTISSSVF